MLIISKDFCYTFSMLRLFFIIFILMMGAVPSWASLSCREIFTERSPYIEGCPFCDAISSFKNGSKPSHFDRTVLATSSNGNFFAKSQRGGFLPGSLLIASNRHTLTRISDMTKQEFVEFLNFYESIKNKIFDSLGEVN